MSQFRVRPAQPADLVQIQAIFAHYVQNTTSSLYYNPVPLPVIESKYQATLDRGLPYLIAEAAESKPTTTSNPKTTSSETTNDKPIVLGYASASAFRAPKLAFSPTVELSVFVHPSYLNRNIGSRLMTALLDALKTTRHQATEPGHDHEPRQFPVRNVLAVMTHDVRGPGREAGDRLIAWYQRFGFETVSRLGNAGWKDGRWVDVVYLQLDLGEQAGEAIGEVVSKKSINQ